MTRPEDRFEFAAMPQRSKWRLPEGKRVAVYTVVNVEEWDIEKPVAREYVTSPAGVVTVPNIPNWAWHEYGMRVGIWRLMEVLKKHNLTASAAINARVCEGSGAPVARALCDAGWALMGHGYAQAPLHMAPDQREVIAKSFDVLRNFSGKAPKGWLGPGLHEKLDSLDILSEVGFKFVCDFPMDEQPVAMRTSSEPIVAMPYTLELSDLPMMVVHQHESRVWLDRVVDQFDRLYAEGVDQPRVMSMSVHPYIMGVPHRIKYFEAGYDYMTKHDDVWFTTAEEIYDWFISHPQ
ncbi:MAG: polysaccharide deacetylase family protein [Candidatus Thiodiazotropha sp. (ex Lucinoma borealis)]|nr:polysaccharide deacetylase family protein [Candidatus Thiodiazotropha sp. (ex Lucinoma borealis)]MCU7875632.1 polysaccharide deacetylase family protein [Candidatus Thiodiazotropha sp. (ex Lucinoma borealis)]